MTIALCPTISLATSGVHFLQLLCGMLPVLNADVEQVFLIGK
jgi:hypothetical protein